MEKERLYDVLMERTTGTGRNRQSVIMADSRENAINKFITLNGFTPGTRECFGGKEVIRKLGECLYSYDYLSDNQLDDYGWYSVIHAAPYGESPFSCDQDYEKDGFYIDFTRTHMALYYSGIDTVSKAMNLIRKWTAFCSDVFSQRGADYDYLRYAMVRQIEKDGGCLESGQDDAILTYMPEDEMFIDQSEPDTRCGVAQLPMEEQGYETYADRTRVHRNQASIDELTGGWSISTLFSDSESTAFAAGGSDADWDTLTTKYKSIAQRTPCRLRAE